MLQPLRHHRLPSLASLAFIGVLWLLANPVATASLPDGAEFPILFVTQVPVPADFATIGSVFANHAADIQSVARGGDLWIRYPDGSLRNLTQEAGYGDVGFQGTGAIAVRDPAVHWDGSRALFSMVVGAPPVQFQWGEYYWQLYEVTGLGPADTAVITKVPKQPTTYNNISPAYGTDGRILFVSDRPRDGERHLYPQHDEYESTPTPTGIWSLDPTAPPSDGELFLLQHSPSGSFEPFVDQAGRVVFTRWDHLQRDQQADADATDPTEPYGTFDYSDESAAATTLPRAEELFPEPRPSRVDLLAGTNLEGHTINHFFPWQVEENGTGEEVLNHLGRHELHNYFNRSLNDDPNLIEFIASVSGRFNPNSVENMLQISEDPLLTGRFVGTDAPEFQTHASGQLISLDAPEGQNADQIAVVELTHPDTRTTVGEGETPPPDHSGHYRDPILRSDGSLVAAHTFETRAAGNEGTRANPIPRYRFRLRTAAQQPSGYLASGAGDELTPGLSKSLTWWDPDVLVTYDGELWELQAVEVRSRPLPPARPAGLDAPEAQIFAEESIDPAALSSWLRDRDLALMVVRNVTTRDANDRQQPYNLRVVAGGAETIGDPGLVYDLDHFQLFQADQLRGIGGPSDPAPGRRVLARPLSGPDLDNPPNPTGPESSVAIAADGSVAAMVPAHRALAWQTTDPAGTPVVRERYWITFAAGEIRSCNGCHGINTANQAGQPAATNPPEALRTWLQYWSASQSIFSDGFESGDTGRWSAP